MWAQSGKELFQENSLADLGSHLYGNAATRTEYLILFWAVVATNYRQFRVPWLFPKKVCVYLLARLICSFPLLNSLPPPLLPFLQSGEKKNNTLLPLENVCFPGCYGDEEQMTKQAWEGKDGHRDPR